MADFTDVAKALVGLISSTVYPNGTAAPSIAHADIKVFQGWPIPEQLEADLKGGKLHISVWPTPTERVMASRVPEWQPLAISSPTVTLTVSGTAVTVGGMGASSQNAALLVDGKPYVYAVQAGDTPASIATALASLINVDQPASSAGSVLTIPGAHAIVVRIGTTGTNIRELRRQEKLFQISVWANSFAKRDPVAAAVDAALAGISRLTFVDGSQGIIRYRSSNQIDNTQKTGIYRRDLLYAVEYSITQTSTDTQVVSVQEGISAEGLPGGATIGQIIINS